MFSSTSNVEDCGVDDAPAEDQNSANQRLVCQTTKLARSCGGREDDPAQSRINLYRVGINALLDTARFSSMAKSIQGLAKGDEALRNRREQLCTSCASKHYDENSGKDSIGHKLVDLKRCDNSRRNAFMTSAIVVGDICDWVQEGPDE